MSEEEESSTEGECYAIFEVLIETDDGIGQSKSETIRWLKENVDEIGEEDIRAIRVLGPTRGSDRTIKIGTEVELTEEIVVDKETVVDISHVPTRP